MAGPPLSGPEQWVAPVVPLSRPHHCTAHSCRCLCLGGQPSCAILDAPNILPHLSSASLLLPLLHQLRCPVALFLLQRLRWQSLAPVILTSRRINGRSDTLYPFHSFQNNITATLTTFVAHALQRHTLHQPTAILPTFQTTQNASVQHLPRRSAGPRRR